MRVLSAEVTNFGSYGNLSFEFDNLGLALVSGPTGAGKSTLLDIIPWCLFGTTAKNGAVDDVRAWQGDGESTTGRISVWAGSGQNGEREITVCRTRGDAGSNDLYWLENALYGDLETKHRGKDLNDTQRLLEQRLGISAETFLTSTYFHEFSSTGNFFVSPAKSRRELFDRVCDLTFPTRLSTAANDLRRGARAAADAIRLENSKLEGRIGELERSQVTSRVSSSRWDAAQKEKISKLEAKAASFEADKVARIDALEAEANAWIDDEAANELALANQAAQLKAIVKDPELFKSNSEACQSCGAMPLDFYDRRQANDRNLLDLEIVQSELEESYAAKNPFLRQIEAAVASENTYTDTLKVEQLLQNPFKAQYAQIERDLDWSKGTLHVGAASLVGTETRIRRLTRLLDLSGSLRGELLRKSVREIEAQTNAYLEKYFDAEIRVGFTVGAADSLDVSIQKSGFECNYKQLSKGQRQILKLCFSVSVMHAAANAAGAHFNAIAFDEALSGLDDEVKARAFSLFETLQTFHSTVLIVDHCEAFKSMFNRVFHIQLVGDVSTVQDG